MNWKCKVGWHNNVVIGTGWNPYKKGTVIVCFGCKHCGKKSTKGEVWHEEDSRLRD